MYFNTVALRNNTRGGAAHCRIRRQIKKNHSAINMYNGNEIVCLLNKVYAALLAIAHSIKGLALTMGG